MLKYHAKVLSFSNITLLSAVTVALVLRRAGNGRPGGYQQGTAEGVNWLLHGCHPKKTSDSS